MTDRNWIAVDWGSSHLRVWDMNAANRVLASHQSEAGILGLTSNEYAAALRELVGEVDVPVIACGMVGSKQGWKEAPYTAVPCKPTSA